MGQEWCLPSGSTHCALVSMAVTCQHTGFHCSILALEAEVVATLGGQEGYVGRGLRPTLVLVGRVLMDTFTAGRSQKPDT